MAAETVLKLTGMGLAPYSARGLTQTLMPIAGAANLRRTISGKLRDLSLPEFRKYSSSIRGNDQRGPAVDSIWPGQLLTVECLYELAYPTGGVPGRPVVPGSSHVDGGTTYYRPVLQMRVVGWTADQDEWGAAVNWTLDLEEE